MASIEITELPLGADIDSAEVSVTQNLPLVPETDAMLAQLGAIDLREGTSVQTVFPVSSSDIDTSAQIEYPLRVGDIQSMYTHFMINDAQRNALNGGKSVVQVYNGMNGTNIEPSLGCALNLWYRQIAPALVGLNEEKLQNFDIEDFMRSPEVRELERYIGHQTGGFDPAYIPSIVSSLDRLGWIEPPRRFDTSQSPGANLRAGDILAMEWLGDSGSRVGHGMSAVALDPTLTRGEGEDIHAVVTTITGGSGVSYLNSVGEDQVALTQWPGDMNDVRDIADAMNPSTNTLSPYGNKITDFTIIRLNSAALRAAEANSPVQISDPLSLEFLSNQGVEEGRYLLTDDELPEGSTGTPLSDRFITPSPRSFSGTPSDYSR